MLVLDMGIGRVVGPEYPQGRAKQSLRRVGFAVRVRHPPRVFLNDQASPARASRTAKGYTYRETDSRCFLKRKLGLSVLNSATVSGVKNLASSSRFPMNGVPRPVGSCVGEDRCCEALRSGDDRGCVLAMNEMCCRTAAISAKSFIRVIPSRRTHPDHRSVALGCGPGAAQQ
jgi:hypothetical protein